MSKAPAEQLSNLIGRLKTIVRILRQQSRDDPAQPVRHVGIDLANRSRLLVADSTTDDETLGPLRTAVAGDYQLRTYLNGDDGLTLGNEYSLDVSIGVPALCPVDAFEENDADTAAALLTEGTHAGLHVCNSDAGWYVIPFGCGQGVDGRVQLQSRRG